MKIARDDIGLVIKFGEFWVGLGVLFTAKAGHEERHLERDVAGYADYRRRVRGRILPWIP